MNHNAINVILITILLSVNAACATLTNNPVSSENSLVKEDKTLVTGNQSANTRPPSKTGTISVEGEKTSINLKLYQEPNLFSTYFPTEEFLVATENPGQTKGVKFIANFGGVKNEKAYIQFVFPNNFQNLEELRNFINSKNGLIAANKWKVVSRSDTLTYPWLKEKIAFSKGQDIVGNIYIGEQKGKVFYVITHLPVEYGDGFSPRENLILNNLEIGG